MNSRILRSNGPRLCCCLLILLALFLIGVTNINAECTKDEVLQMINKGFAKEDIEKICNQLGNKIEGLQLSNEEAKKILQKHFDKRDIAHTTKVLQRIDKRISKLEELISSGQFIPSNRESSGDRIYVPKHPGNTCIDELTPVSSDGKMVVNFHYRTRVVEDIKEIIIDTYDKSAFVTFTLGWDPIEPCYSSYFILDYPNRAGEIKLEKVKLKKYDKGWRIAQ